MTLASVIGSLVEQLNSAVFVLLVILGAVMWMIYKAGHIISRWTDRENSIKELRQDWNRDIPYLKVRLDILYQQNSAGSSLKSTSPINLTDVGKEISAALDAPGIVEKHAKTLRGLVDKANPQTAYDLQQECFAIVDKHLPALLTDEELKIAKGRALHYGTPLDNVLAVVGVLLRDKLLAERGWPLDDVDKPNPSK